MTKSEAVLFVQGIPLDLDQRGLVNIFARAGPVENAKVIPANNPTYSSTYGFVSFTNKTSAATALEMFNNYKIGNKYLNVSYANQSKTPTRNDENRNKDIRSVLNSSRPQSRLSNESDAHSRKSSIGRGTIIHQNSERNGGNRVKRGNFDLSRPFARKILSRSNIINVNSNINNNNANDSFMFSDVEYQKYESESRAINGSNSKTSKEMSKIVNNEILGIERLKIDELYPVYLTHVNTPSNFFVQLIESKEKTANLMNNLDNYYRNGLHEENGAHLKEFCQTRPASIRCKLANVRPPKGNKQWCQKAYDTLDTLFKLKETLFIKVMGIEEFEPSSGRFESIYAVDLIYNFSESILSYFIQNGLGIEEKQSDEIELKIKQNDSQENQKIKLGEGIFKPLEQQQQQQQQVPKSLSSQQLIQSSKSIDTKKEEEKEKQKQQDFLHVVCERTSLITSHSYNVNLQYYDENRLDPFFYVCLTDDFSKLELLDAELQKISTDSSKFKYVEKMSDLKLNDTLEALYEVDSKWYRVQISKISENDKTIEIYFLDYGNSEKLQALVPKTLRFRRKYDSQNELDLFKLKYQAIKCCYKSKTENDSINCFIEKLTNMENIEDGFNIYIKQFIQNENLHVVVFDDEIELLEADREVRNIIESSQGPVQSNNDTELIEQVNDDNLIKASCQDIQFEMNAILKSTFVVHVESVGEFYVQSSDTYEKTIEFQEKIQQLIDALIKFNRSSSTSKPKHSFNVGDFVFGKFLPDSNWYRAIIIKKQQQKSDNNQQDFLYDVYFVDYGNKQENLTSDNLYSFEYVYGLNKSLNFMPQEDLHIIINHPFQAICCKLMDKKETTQNNQILESLVREYLNFDISIIKVEKVKLFNEIVELNKYLVSIGTDQIIGSEGKPLNDLFESIESITNVIKQESSDNSSKSTNPLPPPPQQQQQQQQNPSPVEEKKVFDQQKLEINKFYECKLAALEKEIFANLIEHTDLFAQLESEINADQTIESKYWKCQPEVGDFVLAKFYADESNYSWCRALIVDKSYSVYYFDYGNFGSSITLSDLAPLKSKYDLNAYPPFAFKLILNKVNLDLDTHGHLLAEFLEDKFSVKIKSIESDNLNDDKIKTINFNKYYVEMWDLKKTKCLNKLIDDSYSTTTNTTTTSVEYEPKNEQNTLESEPSKKEPTEIESQEIQKTSFSKLFSSKKTNQLKANVKYIFMDDLVKPFYFCLKTDFDLRNSLDNELNRFYLNQNRESVGDKLDINSYVAVFSESSWFRAQIKSSHLTDTTKTITLFYVDYGYDETIQLDNDNLDRLKKLDAKFYKYPRYAFGASLVNSNESKSDSYEMMNFENKDNDLLADTLKEYFENNSSYDESSLVVVSKLDQNDNLNDEYFYTNEEYYGIMMYNEKDMCLNEMIEKIKTSKKITKKPTRPNSLRLFRDILPKQNPKSDKYCIFARSLDLFYVYNELNVIKVQQDVQLICEKIMQQQNDYELDDENDKPDLNNLVYAKYDDDETWYRCLVTNCDKQKSKYELFYIDFGNTEIIDSKDILIGWSKEHMKPFTDYEAQALKCSLYELRPTNSKTEFTEEDKIKFKQFISDKVFIVNFLRYNQNGNLYDVSLEIDSTQTTDNKSSSAHIFSLREKIAKFSNFDEILITKRTKEENEFLKNLIDRFENC